MTFVPDFPTEGLTGVEYNPRTITPADEAALRESIRELGFCKPVLVTEAGRLVAGHQRTNAACALGMKTVPAYVLRDLRVAAEMRFNQLHNASDVDEFAAEVRVDPQTARGFAEVPWQQIQGDVKQPGAGVRTEIYKLMARYGPWGCSVIAPDGTILSSAQYALTCRMAKRPLRVFVVGDDKRDAVRKYFGREYGVFSYEKLPRRDYLQAFAQPWRQDSSNPVLYRTLRELVRPTDRIFDFGSGAGEGAEAMRAEGFDVTDVELFYRGIKKRTIERKVGDKGATDVPDGIKPKVVHAMIDRMCEKLRTGGLFDVVVCDAVINSVTNLQAEADVLAIVNGFCKPGGIIAISGRARESLEGRAGAKTDFKLDTGGRKVEFIDAHGFSALPRGDAWFFQRFHRKEEILALLRDTIGEKFKIKHGAAWYAHGPKVAHVPEARVREAIGREFDLAWPGGHRVGRAAQVLEAYEAAISVPRSLGK